MAAAPQIGVIRFLGQSGKQYNLSVYFSDVAAGLVNIASFGKAGTGSSTYWKAPERVTLVGMQIHTGMTDTVGVYATTTNKAPLPNTNVNYTQFLDTLPSVFNPSVKYEQGSEISLIQF